MLEKPFLKKALGAIRHGGLEVTFWDGETVTFGPDKPWVSVTFRDPSMVKQMRQNLDMAVGEGYMDGRLGIKGDPAQLGHLGDLNLTALDKQLPLLARRALHSRSRSNWSKQAESADVQRHYDLGNDFYALWLDKSMTYSCAYFKKKSDTLEVAQRQKVDHILRKLALKRGMTLLDIGSGWGELIIRAAKQYGVKAHGITLSHEQLAATKQRIKDEKLTGRVTVGLKHYDDLNERSRYDRVVSVGMYEHVGKGNHGHYMKAVDKVLKAGGLSMLHTITEFQKRDMSPWIDKYIFPGGHLPTLESTFALMPEYDFHVVDYESLRRHYARTLDEWSRRYEKSVKKVETMYGERFVRMWRLYLRSSYAGFQWGNLDLAQILFTKGLSDTLPLTRDYMYR